MIEDHHIYPILVGFSVRAKSAREAIDKVKGFIMLKENAEEEGVNLDFLIADEEDRDRYNE